MQYYGNRWRFFTAPSGVVFLLLAANIAIYVWLIHGTGTLTASPENLVRHGAMGSFPLPLREYWRLVAYGFLHADLLHLASNMACLLLWGPYLEKRVGSLYFVIIYFCALVGAALATDFAHPGSYVTVGASGAIAGILGALLCLSILEKTDLPATFFAANVTLGAAMAIAIPNIDWRAHAGGFAAGLIACALLNLAEHGLRFALRCKFPEFVKVNGAIVFAAFVFYQWRAGALASIETRDWWMSLSILAAASLAFVKLLDLLLSIRKGLVTIVTGFALANAVIVLTFAPWLRALTAPVCAWKGGDVPSLRDFVVAACANPVAVAYVIAAGALALTLLIYRRPLIRGIADVGFVGNVLTAERQRFRGL
jgi:rhomboid protease GluP